MITTENFFTLEELTQSSTANALGVSNLPTTPQQILQLYFLWQELNSIRKELGLPIYVSSAFRSPEVNFAVGGAKESLHMYGCAADISCNDMNKLREVLKCRYQSFHEYIDYGTFIHIGL